MPSTTEVASEKSESEVRLGPLEQRCARSHGVQMSFVCAAEKRRPPAEWAETWEQIIPTAKIPTHTAADVPLT